METALRQSFESVLELRLYPRSAITLHVLVLQSDGGALAGALPARLFNLRAGRRAAARLTASAPRRASRRARSRVLAVAINAGILALLDAGIAMRDYVAACTVVQAQRSLLIGEPAGRPVAAAARRAPPARF